MPMAGGIFNYIINMVELLFMITITILNTNTILITITILS